MGQLDRDWWQEKSRKQAAEEREREARKNALWPTSGEQAGKRTGSEPNALHAVIWICVLAFAYVAAKML